VKNLLAGSLWVRYEAIRQKFPSLGGWSQGEDTILEFSLRAKGTALKETHARKASEWSQW
jgi:hypothetical protein